MLEHTTQKLSVRMIFDVIPNSGEHLPHEQIEKAMIPALEKKMSELFDESSVTIDDIVNQMEEDTPYHDVTVTATGTKFGMRERRPVDDVQELSHDCMTDDSPAMVESELEDCINKTAKKMDCFSANCEVEAESYSERYHDNTFFDIDIA